MAGKIAIILAAGISNRMHTRLPKVLHEICGQPLLSYVLESCRNAGVEKIFLVVGYGKEQVIERYKGCDDIVFVEQTEQRGTGHAVKCCKEHIGDLEGYTMILHGDAPLIRSETLKAIIDKHESEMAAATLGTCILEDPSGYGRIIRDSSGNIQSIVEDADCTAEQRGVKEMNPAFYCFDTQILMDALEKITPDNAKNEYYLTDTLHVTLKAGHKVVAVTAVTAEEAPGVNNRFQLAEAAKIMQRRIQKKLMSNGVTIVDPDNTWIDSHAQIGQDTTIEPFTYIQGEVKIGRECRIGPFAYLRSGTILKDDVVLGVFTEVKNSTLGNSVRARHHSYIGDAEVGDNVNIGAGTITANFDGEKVCRTHIGKDCFLSSGAILIAPLDLKDGSHVKPGRVVSQENNDEIGQEN